MSALIDYPTTREQAKAEGRTYFYANRECPAHKSRFHWTHSGKCMSCFGFSGERIPQVGAAWRRPKPSQEAAHA
jgi:hypothetical protein